MPIGNAREQYDDVIVRRFARGLDNRFVMLRKLPLEGPGKPFPPILVGPVGLFVLNISRAKGFYRARETSWWEIDNTTHRFNPAHPNLIKQSQDYAQKLTTMLDARGKSHPEVIPVLIFADPGVNVESINPVIRIVRMDGIDSLIANLLKSEEVLKPVEINSISDFLEVKANPGKAIPIGEGDDFFGRDLFVREKKAAPKKVAISAPKEGSLPPVEKKLQFSQKQWVIVAVLLALTIIILLVAILYALSII